MILKNGVFFLLKWVSLFGRHFLLLYFYYCQHKLTSLLRLFALLLMPTKKESKNLVHFILEKLNFQKFLNDFFAQFMFPPSSQYVPQGFSQQHLPFIPQSLFAQSQGGRHYIFTQKLLCWGSFPSFKKYIFGND